MKTSFSLLIGLIACLGLSSCEKTITLDLSQTQPKSVVDGKLFFDRLGNPVQQEVVLTRTTDFYRTQPAPRISGAQVSVTDGTTTYPFVEDNDTLGLYRPAVPFQGVPGRTYALTVQHGSERYTATDRLLAGLGQIDSISWQLDQGKKDRLEQNPPDKPADRNRYYEALVYMKVQKDPVEMANYRFLFYRNDTIQGGTQQYFADDEFIGDRVNGIPMPTYYAKGEMAKITVLRVSREVLLYYDHLQKNLNNDGGMWGPVPANPRSNVQGGALGVFQASTVMSMQRRINP